MGNSIFIIKPYNYHGSWVFDDEKVGLVREPFVMGIPEIINLYVSHLVNPEKGFTALFSKEEFPGFTLVLLKASEESGGAWYRVENRDDFKGWLCPALRKYFPEPPEKIYIRIEK